MATKTKTKKTKKESRHVMVRTYSAGVFAGELVSKKPNGAGYFEVTLKDARRMWSWAGAASLSQLATDGTSQPTSCKFPCSVERVELANAIEIIPITAKAKASIDSVPVWKQ